MIIQLCLWRIEHEVFSWLAGPGPHWEIATRIILHILVLIIMNIFVIFFVNTEYMKIHNIVKKFVHLNM